MKATRFFRFFTTLALVLSLASPVFAIDATLAPRTEVTPKSPVPTGTVATWPMDAAVPPGWLACNGQAVPATYPELRALMASVPNYNNRQFLRGSSNGAGSSVADTTRSHTHGQPSHTHAVSVGGLSISGTAAGQRYLDAHTGVSLGPNLGQMHGSVVTDVGGSGEGVSIIQDKSQLSTKLDTSNTRTAQSSSISGTTGWNTFTTGSSGADTTYATGEAETAPMHTLVRFIIKAD